MTKRALLLLLTLLSLSTFATCQDPNASWVQSFTISPSSIPADGVADAIGSITIHRGAAITGPIVVSVSTTISFDCLPPATPGNHACTVPAGSSDLEIRLYFPSSSTNTNTIDNLALVSGQSDPGVHAPLTLAGISNDTEPNPTTETDGPCPTCGKAGQPINLTNGDTWITSTDYSLPGLGGGITIERTWSSFWDGWTPVETAGTFGDSWRSNLNERIQMLTGGGATYWRGNGSRVNYTYDTLGNAYIQQTGIEDRLVLTYDSTAQQYTVSSPDGTYKLFNSAGYLIATRDRNSLGLSISYDAQNRITQVTDSASRSVTFSYNDPNNPNQATSIADAVGTIATYTYDGSSRLTKATYADGSSVNYVYDANSLITAVNDGQGKLMEGHTYDSYRRGLTSFGNGNIDYVSVSYPAPGTAGNPVVTKADLATMTVMRMTANNRHYVSDYTGYTCSTCDVSAGETKYSYNAQGQLAAERDVARQLTTYYDYDSAGNVVTIEERGTQTTYQTFTYNSLGEVLIATDRYGKTTTNTYDANGNLLTTTSPAPDGSTSPSVTSFTYDAQGQLLTITDPRNNVTTLTYTPGGLVETVTDAHQQVTSFEYDNRGNRTAIVDARTQRTTFSYDSMNRLTTITYPDQTTTNFVYDYRGRRTSVTDGNGKITTYVYDDADRLTSTTDPNLHTTTYAYRTSSSHPERLLSKITDARLKATTFTYDTHEFLKFTNFPAGVSEWINASSDGPPSFSVDRNNKETDYSYDNFKRLTVFRNPYPTGSANFSYTYDLEGRLTQVGDTAGSPANAGTYTFSYDNLGRLTQTTVQYPWLTRALTVKYTYDAAGNRTSMTDAENGITSYAYDELNRLTSITNPQSQQFTFSYDELGRRTMLTRPNGVNTSYTYDSLSHLTAINHQLSGANIDGATYTYDNAGNRTSKLNLLDSSSEMYTYDNAYQLTAVVSTPSGGTPTTTESYSYDAVGNPTSSLNVNSYLYDNSNRLTSSSDGVSYTYDANGNTLTRVDASGTTTYNWNYQNQLASVVLPAGAGTITYNYDPFGRRIRKITPTSTTIYLYDGANLIEELDASGNAVAQYTQGLNIDEPLAMLRGGVPAYYEADGLGSITSLTDSAGVVANSYKYDTFGKQLSTTGTLVNPFQYTGREWDGDISIYENRARYYDQRIGRFIAEDPIRFKGGIDFYAYVDNYPTGMTDPSGLAPVSAPPVVSPWTQAEQAAYRAFVRGLEGTSRILSRAATAAMVVGYLIDPSAGNNELWAHSADYEYERRASAAKRCSNGGRRRGNEEECWEMYETDIQTCRKSKNASCYDQAMQRYAACIAGRPIPPFPYRRNN